MLITYTKENCIVTKKWNKTNITNKIVVVNFSQIQWCIFWPEYSILRQLGQLRHISRKLLNIFELCEDYLPKFFNSAELPPKSLHTTNN